MLVEKRKWMMIICDALFSAGHGRWSTAQWGPTSGVPPFLSSTLQQGDGFFFFLCSIVSHLFPRLRISDNHINGLALSPSSQGSKHLYYRWILSIKSKFKLRWCNIDIGIDIDLFLQPLNGARTVECGDPGAEWGGESTCDQEGKFIFWQVRGYFIDICLWFKLTFPPTLAFVLDNPPILFSGDWV